MTFFYDSSSADYFVISMSYEIIFIFISLSHLYVVLLLISSIFAAPGVTTTNKTACTEECSLEYDPICAGEEGNTNEKMNKSFGNICVMYKYNCEKNESLLPFFKYFYSIESYLILHASFLLHFFFSRIDLVKLSDGECPGGKSVRLQ